MKNLFRAFRIALAAVAILLAYFLVLFMVHVRPDKVPGTYKAEYAFGAEEFILRENGTYLQRIRLLHDPRDVEKTGTWTYNPKDGNLRLEEPLALITGSGEFIPAFRETRPGFQVIPICYNLPFGRLGFCGSDLPIHWKVSP